MPPLYHPSLHNQTPTAGKAALPSFSNPFPRASAVALVQARILSLWNYCTRITYLQSPSITTTSGPPREPPIKIQIWYCSDCY